MERLSLNIMLFSIDIIDDEVVRHEANYLENNINRINNIVKKNQYTYKNNNSTTSSNHNDSPFNFNFESNNDKKPETKEDNPNEIIIKGSTLFLETEKDGIRNLLDGINNLNNIISNELTRILELKETYSDLDKKLIFNYDITSSLLSLDEIKKSDEVILEEEILKNPDDLIYQKCFSNPFIKGKTYTKEELEENYGVFIADFGGLFDLFKNPNNQNEYIIPDIVFEKEVVPVESESSEGTTTEVSTNYYVYVRVEDTKTKNAILKEIKDMIKEIVKEENNRGGIFGDTIASGLAASGIDDDYSDGILRINLTSVLELAVNNGFSTDFIDKWFVLPSNNGGDAQ